jgi:hypothetical protein
MDADTLIRLAEWLFGQDPLVLLVVGLLVRSEVRTRQLVKALSVLSQLGDGEVAASKTTLI